MAFLGFNGFETGDASQLPSGLGAGYTISTAVVRSGVYSLNENLSAQASYVSTVLAASLALSEVFTRIALSTSLVGSHSNLTSAQHNIVVASASSNLAQVLIGTTTGNQIYLGGFYVNSSGTFIDIGLGSSILLDPNTQYVIEMHVLPGAGTGVFQIWLGGALIYNGTSLDIKNQTIDNVNLTGKRESATQYFVGYWDDMAWASARIGDGRTFAFQGAAGTPTYNAFTKTGAATAALCWSQTPVDATKNCTSTSQNQAQTMLLSSIANGGTVLSGKDTINACQAMINAKLLAGTNLRTYAIRQRMNGVDTDFSITSLLTASDQLLKATIFTDTVAHLQAGEIGATRGATTANSKELQVEDCWLMVDVTQAPRALSAIGAG